MFESINKFFRKIFKAESHKENSSGKEAKERLHLVLMQDRANVSADFLDMMKQEIIEVIKKYICVDENAIDVRLTNQPNDDGTNGAPALYANIPIISIKEGQNNVSKNNDEKEKDEKQEIDEIKKEENKDDKINEEVEEKIENIEAETEKEDTKEENKNSEDSKESKE